MLQETFSIKGKVNICHYDKENNLIKTVDVPNLVVDSGKVLIAARLLGNTRAVVSHVALGSNTANTNSSQTELLQELGRKVLDSSSRTSNTITYISTFEPGVATGTLTEAGLFNAAANGDMLCRTTYSAVIKGALDTIVITWQVSIN